MTNISRVQLIKKERRESLLLKEISNLFFQASLDDRQLQDFVITRVSLSNDKSVCSVFFYSSKGEQYFNEKLEVLKLYKPSLRKALAQAISTRYVPELIFKYDAQFEKQKRIEELIDKLKEEGQL